MALARHARILDIDIKNTCRGGNANQANILARANVSVRANAARRIGKKIGCASGKCRADSNGSGGKHLKRLVEHQPCPLQ